MRTAAFVLCALLAASAVAQPKPDALTPDGGRYFGSANGSAASSGICARNTLSVIEIIA